MNAIPQKTFPAFSNLIGIPYSKKDCFEIVRDFYKQVLGVELKHYYDSPGQEAYAARDLIYTSMGDFVKVESPQFGDLVLLKIKGIECHIGIYLGNNQLFHSSRYTGSVIDRMSRWQNVVSGYYRVRGLND